MHRPIPPSRPLFVALVALALGGIPAPAGAALLFQDSFSHPNGNLVPLGGWYAHSAGGAKPVQVSGHALLVSESPGTGEDLAHPIPPRLATDRTYAAFRLKLLAGSVVGTVNDYVVHFRPGAPDTLNFVARVYVGPPTGGGDYVLGIATGPLGTTPLAPWPNGLVFGVTYDVVIAYDGATGGSTLWVNPASEGSTSVSSVFAGSGNRALASIALRQASPAGATYAFVFDEVRVGESFADVTAPTNAAPAAGVTGLMLLSATMLAAGGLLVARRATSA